MAIEADVAQAFELAVAADLLLQNRAQLGGDASALPWQEGGQRGLWAPCAWQAGPWGWRAGGRSGR